MGLTAALIFVAAPALAGSWQVCEIEARVLGTRDVPQALRVAVLQARPESASVECPAVGEELIFVPETADYQQSIPRKRYPKTGAKVALKRIYLDGQCKPVTLGLLNPCRITHFPTGW